MAMIIDKSLTLPVRDAVLDERGFVAYPWYKFLDKIINLVRPLGEEKRFEIANNVGTPTDVSGLSFDKTLVSAAIVECLFQRVTTGAGAQELLELFIFSVVYKPTSDTWGLTAIEQNSPADSGVTLSITSSGQVQYETSNITGTAYLSRIIWRARTLAAKHNSYSGFARVK